MTLSRDGVDVILEPKVLAVLLYLYQHHDTYISMDELHENVWQGRVVSDAAVRRTISKLRLLFKDDHKVPRYVKSLPKRGYKLICPVSAGYNQGDSGLEITPDKGQPQAGFEGEKEDAKSREVLSGKAKSQLADNSQVSPIQVAGTKAKKSSKQLVLSTLFLVVLLLASCIYYFTKTGLLTPEKSVVSSEVVNSLPGDKLALAQSPDRQYFAFSGKVSEHTGYQVYIKREKGHDFLPVTHDAHVPISLAFSVNNDALFYSDMKEGKSSLNSISLGDSADYQTQPLLENYFKIGNIFISADPKFVYFSGQKKANEPRYIYRYNRSTQQTVRVTSSTHIKDLDIKGTITPDGKLMAVLRYSEFENADEIRIINLDSKAVIYRRQQSNIVYDLRWFDNENLLILNKEQLLKLDYKQDAGLELLGRDHNLIALADVDRQQLLAVSMQKSVPKNLFFEQELPFNDWTTRKIYNVNPNVFYMAHQADDETKTILVNKGEIATLAKLHTGSNKSTPYIETEYSLLPVASASSGLQELIKINHRFALLNTKTSSLTYITSGDDYVGDASFTYDEKDVLFSVKGYEQWEVYRYNIASGTSSLLFGGFRYIRAYGDDFILGTAEGELFWHNSQTGEQVALNNQLSTEPNTHWDVNGNFIFWSSHDLVQTTFYQLDISNISKPLKLSKSFDYNKIMPYFSVKKDGSSLLYSVRQQDKSEILALTLEQ
ncbi:winged helix-turn-helix domain-containing protein [Thalassomonas haliotis]|uniref:Winged helix-turn-helix domain-containing protein n=1 Tax=Thalassomonas haliotis TaxID=485448 RepID=A0ABY7VEN0_9GAMM|nr:winged helix-turn-helix domain-containing protein [Thalassomonas haliotis]WDE12170.1 winged helix-turn-helix domain-containing protein [Thalassomonas haliotis]